MTRKLNIEKKIKYQSKMIDFVKTGSPVYNKTGKHAAIGSRMKTMI